MTAAATQPTPTWVNRDADEGQSHVTCCDPDRALCGERLTGDWLDDEDPIDCIRCEVIDRAGVPCGAALCKLRQWWRSR